MAKYKYLRGGRVFESDKEYNLPRLGADGKLVKPLKTDPKIDPKKSKEVPPTFKTQAEHDAFYRKQLLEKAKAEKPDVYNQYLGLQTTSDTTSNEDILIAMMGGLPKFSAPNRSFDGSKSRIKDIAFKPDSPEGYQYNQKTKAAPNKGQPDAESVTKRRFVDGGIKKKGVFNPIQVNTPDFSQRINVGGTPAVGGSTSTAKPAQSFSSILGSTAPFLDNIANLVATNKTPNIPQPILTKAPRLATKLNINPQKRRIENDVRSAQIGIDRSTSSAGVANANKGKLLADKFRAIGDLEANKQNFEAEQGNRQAGMDFQAQSNNNQLLNQRNSMQMMREDDINTRYASVVSDFGSDIANINRESNLMARDKDALRTIMKTNPDAVYQFADTDMFVDLFKGDEPALRRLIMSQKGSAQKAKLAGAYKRIFNRDYTE